MSLQSLALYVHWPFCQSKCPYCDFNSHVRDIIDVDRWRDCLLRELAHNAARTGQRHLTSIFFGGGTPSLMPPQIVGALIDAATRHWTADEGIEITLEANPTSVEADRLADFAKAGINRISLGVQALNDPDLRALGRQHSAAEALSAVEMAHRTVDNVSFDLIYGRPGQNVDAWAAELEDALNHAGDHLSVYQLTIEQGTAFESLFRQGRLAMPDQDSQADFYEVTQDILAGAGMPAYEISNHARPGKECRHNLTYWRYADYVGIGPGAHGRLTLKGDRVATRAHRAPEVWLERVSNQGHGYHGDERIERGLAAEEALMMGLRLTEGVCEARFQEIVGQPLDLVLNPHALGQLREGGFIQRANGRFKATAEGRQRLNAILMGLLNQEPGNAKVAEA